MSLIQEDHAQTVELQQPPPSCNLIAPPPTAPDSAMSTKAPSTLEPRALQDTDILHLQDKITQRPISRRGTPFNGLPDRQQLYDGSTSDYADGIIDLNRADLEPESMPPDVQAYLALVDRLRHGRVLFTPVLTVGEVRAGAQWLQSRMPLEQGLYIDPKSLPDKPRPAAEASTVPLWKVLTAELYKSITTSEDLGEYRLRRGRKSHVQSRDLEDMMIMTNIRADFPPYIRPLSPCEFMRCVYAIYDPSAHAASMLIYCRRVESDVDFAQYNVLLIKSRRAVCKQLVPDDLRREMRECDGSSDSDDESEEGSDDESDDWGGGVAYR
ncbi:hypothetical protein IAT38_002843 [Cryptococcus sp. DSM 104549]